MESIVVATASNALVSGMSDELTDNIISAVITVHITVIGWSYCF